MVENLAGKRKMLNQTAASTVPIGTLHFFTGVKKIKEFNNEY